MSLMALSLCKADLLRVALSCRQGVGEGMVGSWRFGRWAGWGLLTGPGHENVVEWVGTEVEGRLALLRVAY